jgi:hypothetical protein
MIILPCEHDVLYGRSKNCFRHLGNQTFRMLIAENVAAYKIAATKKLKMQIVVTIVDTIIARGGRFLTQDKQGHWKNGGKNLGKTKVGNALRDAQRGRIRILANLSTDEIINCVAHAHTSQEENDKSYCRLDQRGQFSLRSCLKGMSSNQTMGQDIDASFESSPEAFLERKWKGRLFSDKQFMLEPTIDWKKGMMEQDRMNEYLDDCIVDEFCRLWK